MQQGAIFDMDGLLFDTEKMYQHGWLVVADEFGVPRSPELGKACCGTSGETMAAVVHSFYPTVDAYAYSRRVAEYVRQRRTCRSCRGRVSCSIIFVRMASVSQRQAVRRWRRSRKISRRAA